MKEVKPVAFTHLNEHGSAQMVDVSEKSETAREAVARGYIRTSPELVQLITDQRVPKGDVLSVARIAGIMAAKRTSDLIPLCHPLPLQSVLVDFALEPNGLKIEARCKTVAKTGVEMEALTAVSVAALTVYDMCKAIDRSMTIEGIALVRKSGGQSGDFLAAEAQRPT